MKVYIVTTEDGEDYHIVRAFDNRPDAEAFANELGRRLDRIADTSVEEYDTAEPTPAPGMWHYFVMMDRDGGHPYSSTFEACPRADQLEPRIHPGFRLRNGVSRSGRLEVVVEATDEDHAVKVVNAMRTRLIAEGKWPDTPAPKEER